MNLDTVPEETLKEILALKQAEIRLVVRDRARSDFMAFAHHVYENFIEGKHHKIIAEKLERIANGKLKRLIVICLQGIVNRNLHLISCLHGFLEGTLN